MYFVKKTLEQQPVSLQQLLLLLKQTLAQVISIPKTTLPVSIYAARSLPPVWRKFVRITTTLRYSAKIWKILAGYFADNIR